MLEHVQEETLTMLMGKMMTLIQGRTVAEDDEHTEVILQPHAKAEPQLTSH